ncbi:MAG: transposase, partial [Phycisphaerae bacterium]|nr:transposase [Phycisphaerae bacterium]
TLALAAILMSWDPAPTLAQRFESVLSVLGAALPRRRRTGRTYQGLAKALARRGAALRGRLAGHLREQVRRLAGRDFTLPGGLVPIGVDGSRFDVPRTVANEQLGLGGRDKCGPQIAMLLLMHLGVMLPWAWRCAGVNNAERTLLRSLLGVLPENALLVADAGFTGYELLSELRSRGVHTLVRVGGHVRLLRDLGCCRRRGPHTVYLWPGDHRSREPLTLRLIRVGDVYLVTTVTDPRVLSRRAACELYRRRWGLEVAFRTLKQTLERRRLRSCTPRRALAELDWSVLGAWLLGVMGAGALRGARVCPRRLSYAGALAAVRHAARGRCSAGTLRRRLRRCVIDDSRRRGSKKAYRWPHKKNPAPPGAPRITTATPEQVAAAKALAAHPTHA